MDNDIIKRSKSFIEEINLKYPIELAYLFGSFAKNQDNKMSDIDIALRFKESYDSLRCAFIRGEIIDLGQAFFSRPVDVVSINEASLFLKYEIIKDGIVLIDSDDRASFESLVLREYFDFKYYSDIYDAAVVESIKNKTYFGG